MTKVFTKPQAFYDVFERKGGPEPEATHYCPGCGHGILHKLIAEAVDDLGIRDRTILVSPVGCSVFAYYYFDLGNVQAAHGRAPAVATGIKRARPESIVLTYQGDGDLAAIGLNNILQAANRGEHLTVFFINNALYGMTGGQMAPTSVIGQKTTTTPYGRKEENEGFPLTMCELVSALRTPVYIERTSVASPKHIMKTRKAVRHALECQIEGKGFSFVEVIAQCPTGWKMTPEQSLKWIEENLFPVFPLKVFRDDFAARTGHPRHAIPVSEDAVRKAVYPKMKEPATVPADDVSPAVGGNGDGGHPADKAKAARAAAAAGAGAGAGAAATGAATGAAAAARESAAPVSLGSAGQGLSGAAITAAPIRPVAGADRLASEMRFKIAGFGGQGILYLGEVLATAGMRDGYPVSWLPSYGPEMRGGTAHCHVIVSPHGIGSPLVEHATHLVAMNRPSLERFIGDVDPGGMVLYDSSLIDITPPRDDVIPVAIPATKIADEIGATRVANIVMLGALVALVGQPALATVAAALGEAGGRAELIALNKKALEAGYDQGRAAAPRTAKA